MGLDSLACVVRATISSTFRKFRLTEYVHFGGMNVGYFPTTNFHLDDIVVPCTQMHSCSRSSGLHRLSADTDCGADMAGVMYNWCWLRSYQL